MIRPLIPFIRFTLLSLVFAAGPALAQTAGSTSPETFGAWTIVCEVPAGANEEQCAVKQDVVAEDREELGLAVIVYRTADNKARILRVITSLGVMLPNGLGLRIDDKDVGKANFLRCTEVGCYVEVILTDELLAQMSDGTSALFIVFATPEEGIGIPVELDGLKEAYAALK